MTSQRKYLVILPPDSFLHEATTVKVSIHQILEPRQDGSDFEYIYALTELQTIDRILDMKPLDVLKFQGNRDNKDEPLSLLIRIN